MPQSVIYSDSAASSTQPHEECARQRRLSNDFVKRKRSSHLDRPSNFFLRTQLILLSALSASVEGTLFQFSAATSLSNLATWSASSQKSTVVPLDFDIPLFGNATIDRLWFSAFGTLSYNQLISKEVSPDEVDDNIVLAPYFLPSSSGSVKYERYSSSAASQLAEANNNVQNYIEGSFSATHGVLAQWTEVKSPEDSSLKNTFQAFIVTDESEAYAIFNYDQIQYTTGIDGDTAAVGAFVNSEDTNSCWRVINGTNLDLEQLTQTSNCRTPGRWVMRLDEILHCRDQFTTACGDEPQNGEWTHETGFFENSNRWDFFVRYSCKDDFEITPNNTIQDSFCVYDPDYYESKWSCVNPPRCQDFSVAKDYETTLIITHIDGIPINQIYKEEGEAGYEEFQEKVTQAIQELLVQIGLDESVVTEINISKDNVSINRDAGGDEVLTVEFDSLLPTQTKDTATETDIEEAFNEFLASNPEVNDVVFLPSADVKDKSRACLELCLGCKNPNGCQGPPPEIPPNKCCGTCSNPNHEGGKAYSTINMACCKDQFIYNPDTHSCCDSGSKSAGGYSLFMKVKGSTCGLDGPN